MTVAQFLTMKCWALPINYEGRLVRWTKTSWPEIKKAFSGDPDKNNDQRRIKNT